jgi:peptidoglycan/xylan/chitin deacetylase (PgdA/CDA1 family)
MRKVWIITILSVNLIFILFLIRHLYSVPLILPAGIAAFYLITMIYGSFAINSGFYINTVCRGVTTEKQLALTFDDHPAGAQTHRVLDILKENQIKATFFCIGNRISGNEDVLLRMQQEGHLIGNHSYSHSVFWGFFLPEKAKAELEQASEQIFSVIRERPLLFRPPFGVTNPSIRKAVNKLQLTTVGWSLRSFDTVISDEQKVLNRIKKKLHPGAIVLLHERHPGIDVVLNGIITFARNEGYQIVALDKLLTITPYEK